MKSPLKYHSWIDILVYAGIILMVVYGLFFSGCKQVIVEPGRMQINTFLMNSELDGLYFDPNDGFFEASEYSGVPANIWFEFDPIFNRYKMVIESE